MSASRVIFVGCGPGAPDLLTVRAVRAIGEADIVIWNRSLIEEQAITELARPEVEIIAWPPATERDVLEAFDRARSEDLVVVRLKGGDPTLFGAMDTDLAAVRERELAYEIVPGISAASATAAALGREIARTEAPLLLAAATDLARDDAARVGVAAWNAGRDPAALQRALAARGLAADTACTVVVDVSRRGETLALCRLDELAETIGDLGVGALTFVLADPAPDDVHQGPSDR